QLNYFPNQQLDQSLINFCTHGFTIGSIGRLSKEKGYKYLIEALEILIEKGIDARLVIMGEGYERPFLENLISELGFSKKVLLPGYIDEANLYIPFFNVFVISSLTEGLPITLLEAMLSKVPIVASEVGGIPDVLINGDSGILVQPCKSEAIAEAIFRIYNDSIASDLVKNAEQVLRNHYTANAMASQYLNIYKEIYS
ncbi:MAG: glycosyltransferase family 4 protein, partial [Deltaproteobacteria bacterium]|nr:glycosyltransferase family 4 protein [Deltaproteobacteria bacterium]